MPIAMHEADAHKQRQHKKTNTNTTRNPKGQEHQQHALLQCLKSVKTVKRSMRDTSWKTVLLWRIGTPAELSETMQNWFEHVALSCQKAQPPKRLTSPGELRCRRHCGHRSRGGSQLPTS